MALCPLDLLFLNFLPCPHVYPVREVSQNKQTKNQKTHCVNTLRIRWYLPGESFFSYLLTELSTCPALSGEPPDTHCKEKRRDRELCDCQVESDADLSLLKWGGIKNLNLALWSTELAGKRLCIFPNSPHFERSSS